MRTRSYIGIFLIAGILAAGAAAQEEGDAGTLRLSLGDPQYKGQFLQIKPDTLFSARTGSPLDYSDMIEELAQARLVYVGESHDSMAMHEIQARIIRSLYEQDPNFTIGMEMFTHRRQEYLNKWSAGLLTVKEFIREAEWYVAWNFNFNYYADIFDAAKTLRIPIFGLNAPRELISKLRMRGWDALSSEEQALVPEPDVSHEEHRAYIRSIFQNMDMPAAMKGPGLDKVFEGLYRAQSAWDEVMAENILKSLAYTRRKMVVLAGSGHLMYNLGINRRAFEDSGWPFKTVVCVEVPEGQDSLEVARTLGDYIWGLPAEERPVYPSLGLSLKTFDGLANPVVDRKPFNGVALDAGFEKGDVILSVENHEFADINTLRTFLAHFTWGDTVEFIVLRDAQPKSIKVLFELKEEQRSGGEN